MKRSVFQVNSDQVPKLLAELRIKKGITQDKLAKKIGTGQAAISRVENGRDDPSIDLIQRIADALGLKVELKFTQR